MPPPGGGMEINMKNYTDVNPAFDDAIKIAEATDPGHADIINAAPKQLLANTLVLKDEINTLREDIKNTGIFENEEGGGEAALGKLDIMQNAIEALQVPEFSESNTRENINSGEPYDILFGKIEKWLSDLKSAAFASIADNCITTEEGHVLDARQGTALQEQVDEINGNIDSLKKSVADGKALIAAAITRKGITTASDADFETIAANIDRIVVSTDTVHSVYATCTYNGKATNQMVMTLYKDGQPLGSKNYTSSAYGTYSTNTYSV